MEEEKKKSRFLNDAGLGVGEKEEAMQTLAATASHRSFWQRWWTRGNRKSTPARCQANPHEQFLCICQWSNMLVPATQGRKVSSSMMKFNSASTSKFQT
ncbi:hypothetical protein GUJ93_ZPchr0010g9238 [Zizania palustris]|uniref:Uncharacterized protein n=1 Tax=Zizania palustris TaxID=103762 RepID=A0A8J5WD13_ZIZPA|nr:hypothetical protein GUJ93_ZPchr0010g9238 [Zizania palustris]KAG8087275.1 hypothetical protein GUJ93_ZPchr0010g9238 [Zizania palustris]